MNPIISNLTSWLDATTTYAEPKDNLNKKPNHEGMPMWRTFYYSGPMLVEDNSGIVTADEPVSYKLARVNVSYNSRVSPGEIISSGNGRKYLIFQDGSLRRIK